MSILDISNLSNRRLINHSNDYYSPQYLLSLPNSIEFNDDISRNLQITRTELSYNSRLSQEDNIQTYITCGTRSYLFPI